MDARRHQQGLSRPSSRRIPDPYIRAGWAVDGPRGREIWTLQLLDQLPGRATAQLIFPRACCPDGWAAGAFFRWHLRAARPADCDLWAYPSLIYTRLPGPRHRLY